MLHSWNSRPKRVSMCNSCSNGAHLHAPFMKLSPEMGLNVQQLQQRSSSACSIRETLNRNGTQCATVAATELIGMCNSVDRHPVRRENT